MKLPLGCVEKCRGCSHRLLSQEESLLQKRAYLEKTLSHWNEKWEWEDFAKVRKRFHYRPRAVLHVRFLNASWEIGLLRKKYEDRKREEEIIEIPECPVQLPEINQLITSLRAYMTLKKITATSFPLRKIVVQWPLVVFVLKAKKTVELEMTAHQLLHDFLQGEAQRNRGLGFFINFHPDVGRGNLRIKSTLPLFGAKEGSLETKEYGTLKYGPGHFMQTSSDLFFQALQRAANYFTESGVRKEEKWRLADLYCGVGFAAPVFSALGFQVIGIELNGEAIEFARKNSQGEFLQGRVGDRLIQLMERLDEDSENERVYVLMNPPRSGAEKEVWKKSFWNRVKQVAYLSCEPLSLLEDLKHLQEFGFSVDALIPYDFFPNTKHIEVLALLSKLE